ncbi:hypothetical protein [Kitasatospora sp. NPDC093679]|uniref:hypothetical protein n=1 Tax=Kitasatospora sp. NPDC093679 TaxID=3154983 RepID=UPI0034232B14
MTRPYRYVGPPDIARKARTAPPGVPVRTTEELADWLGGREPDELREPVTFVVDERGVLLLAPRRSEHVACAGGRPVLAAGEIAFVRGSGGGWEVSSVTNQSTGYAPGGRCFPSVAAAVAALGLTPPDRFDPVFVFRRCPVCRDLNVVREEDFHCAPCGSALPHAWNVDGH